MLIEVPRDKVDRSINEAIDGVVRAEVLRQLGDNEAFRAYVHNAVNAEVKSQAPGNPRIQMVIQEVRDHLDRYPSIAHDAGLQDAVGVAIFNWLQKTS